MYTSPTHHSIPQQLAQQQFLKDILYSFRPRFDEILSNALKFVDKAPKDGKPFFLWLNPTRMQVVTHLSPKYEGMRNAENNWTIQNAGMAQLDDIVGAVMKYVKDAGLEGDTIIGFTTDNGAENFTWPHGGPTPFARGKSTALEGGFRVPMFYVGQAMCPLVRLKMVSYPAWTGSQPLSRLWVIPISRMNF